MAQPLILASASPRRRELLVRVGVALEVVPASVDETVAAGEAAVPYAQRVAAAKADAIAASHPGRWILAADTVVETDGNILGKAAGAGEAQRMLLQLSGRTHRVTTAFSIRGPDTKRLDSMVTTEVTMREFSAGEAAAYIAGGEWRGKAGAYAVQGMAAALVSQVRGSVTNVIGLPLAEVVVALADLGGPATHYAAGEPA